MSADEQVGLRGMQPRPVVDVLDAVSSSRRNPQATEAARKEAGNT